MRLIPGASGRTRQQLFRNIKHLRPWVLAIVSLSLAVPSVIVVAAAPRQVSEAACRPTEPVQSEGPLDPNADFSGHSPVFRGTRLLGSDRQRGSKRTQVRRESVVSTQMPGGHRGR